MLLIVSIIIFEILDIIEIIMTYTDHTKNDTENIIKFIRINNCVIIFMTVMDFIQFLSLNKFMSPFVDIFYQIFNDIVYFLIVLVIFVVAFALSFWLLS